MSLLDPFTLRGVTMRNRIVVSPMCQYSSTDGFADDWHLVHLGQFAVGGAAVVFNGDTLFLIQAPLGPFTAADRAVAVSSRLARVARDPALRHDTLATVVSRGTDRKSVV